MTVIGKAVFATALILIATVYCEVSTFIVSQASNSSASHWLNLAQGVCVNFVYLGVCTAIFMYVNPAIIPNWYFTPKPLERDGQVYRFVGIKLYEMILRRIGWERLLRKDSPVRSDLASLQKISDMTRGAEAIHLVAAILTAVFTLTVAVRYVSVGTRWWWIFNGLLNVYPVMLQRYNRPRLERLIERIRRRQVIVAGQESESD